MGKYCAGCGAEIKEGANFCNVCGRSIEDNNTTNQGPSVDAGPSYDYQNQANPQQPTGAPINKPPVIEKNIALCIIFSIITCGIYGFYWIYTMNDDLATVSGKEPEFSGGMVILLSIVTCGIFMYYWLYKAGTKLAETNESLNRRYDTNSSIIYIILNFVGLGIISYALIQSEINKLLK